MNSVRYDNCTKIRLGHEGEQKDRHQNMTEDTVSYTHKPIFLVCHDTWDEINSVLGFSLRPVWHDPRSQREESPHREIYPLNRYQAAFIDIQLWSLI